MDLVLLLPMQRLNQCQVTPVRSSEAVVAVSDLTRLFRRIEHRRRLSEHEKGRAAQRSRQHIELSRQAGCGAGRDAPPKEYLGADGARLPLHHAGRRQAPDHGNQVPGFVDLHSYPLEVMDHGVATPDRRDFRRLSSQHPRRHHAARACSGQSTVDADAARWCHPPRMAGCDGWIDSARSHRTPALRVVPPARNGGACSERRL